MLIRRYFPSILFALFFLAAFSLPVLACACCAEPGTYSIRTLKPDPFHLELISEFRFAAKANLYMTEAGFVTIR